MALLVAVDVDGPLAYFAEALCNQLSLAGVAVTPKQLRHWCLKECLGASAAVKADEIMSRPGFCASIPWMPGARQLLRDLREYGYDVIAVTSPHHSRTWLEERREWLLSEFEGKDILFASGLRKALVRADFLIEDHPGNAAAWCRMNPRGRAALVDRPWNGPDAKEWEFNPAMTRLQDLNLFEWITR